MAGGGVAVSHRALLRFEEFARHHNVLILGIHFAPLQVAVAKMMAACRMARAHA